MRTSTKNLAGTAVFAALAFVISLLEFPIFPVAPFLQLDFSLVFILLAGFAFGPVSGITASAVKEVLRFSIGSGTGGVGEIANFLVTTAFILLPTITYRYKKGLPVVIITLAGGMVAEAVAALLANRFINFPLFMGDQAAQVFSSLWVYVLLFNIIKTAAVSVISLLLYKRLSKFLKRFERVLSTKEKNKACVVKCAYCGKKYKDTGLLYCPKCGAPIERESAPKYSEQ